MTDLAVDFETNEVLCGARYLHPDRTLRFFRPLPPEVRDLAAAAQLGCSPERYREILDALQAIVVATAADLVADAGFAAELARLPITDDDRIVGMGDSITADRFSWFNLLRACRGLLGSRAAWADTSVMGRTSHETVAAFAQVAELRPTLVLQMLGTNDVRRQGLAGQDRMCTLEESARHFSSLRRLVAEETSARLVVITPPPLDPTRLRPPASPGDSSRIAADLDELAEQIRSTTPDLGDVQAALRGRDLGPLLRQDGLHPTLAGQVAILRAVVHQLARR